MNTNDALERHTLLVRLRIKVAVQTCKECLFDSLKRAITSTGQQESIAELVFLELDRSSASLAAATASHAIALIETLHLVRRTHTKPVIDPVHCEQNVQLASRGGKGTSHVG